jgi:hypothetical protein
MWIVLAVVLATRAATSAPAHVRYLTWSEHTRRGVIATPAGRQQVELGDSVPGYGTVIELDETRVVLRRVLSEAERASLVARGFADYGARQLEVIREDLAIRLIPVR